MIKELVLAPEEALDEIKLIAALHARLGIPQQEETRIHIHKRSIDARSRHVVVRVQYELISGQTPEVPAHKFLYKDVTHAAPVLIVGAGPAGLFCALRLIEHGLKPIILERGKDVQSRRRDIAALNKEMIVNPDSNYCFGEGGAGTYSDGKLYTRSNKRGDIDRILTILINHGAKADIRYDAHPHIGTNKLPPLIAAMRQTILEHGGEVHFEKRVTDLIIESGTIQGVRTQDGDRLTGEAVVLATGHSARDIYELLNAKGVALEAKPFALGLRVEHSQNLIDQIQYHCSVDRGPVLPAASYSLVHQATVDGIQRGVFSFCMCPGGFIVPAATAPGEIVVNGMSPSRRDSRFANSGIVVSVELEDSKGYPYKGPLAAMQFQSAIERRACESAGATQRAPAQRLVDFVEGRHSNHLLETSYQPGITSVDLDQVLPPFITESLRQGFRSFGKKMKGYLTNDAQVLGVESRTSSPVRIPRNKETLEHSTVKRLIPCGEGAGYAGGIVSAAMDGERCADAVGNLIKSKN